MILYPNKSLYYKKYLPDEYLIKYRPALEIYKNKLGDKILDCYTFLKNIDDAYYKTDTHINLNGNYHVYLEFIKKINLTFSLNLVPKKIQIQKMNDVELNNLNIGIGDLTWNINLGNQNLIDKNDNYYFTNDVENFYIKHIINVNGNIFFLDTELNNKKTTSNKIAKTSRI
jgi:hypothetical protein